MYEEQNGRCAICGNEGNGKWKKLCVDHCHTTGKVRKLLCNNCNTAMGLLGDNTQIIQSMIDYLNN